MMGTVASSENLPSPAFRVLTSPAIKQVDCSHSSAAAPSCDHGTFCLGDSHGLGMSFNDRKSQSRKSTSSWSIIVSKAFLIAWPFFSADMPSNLLSWTFMQSFLGLGIPLPQSFKWLIPLLHPGLSSGVPSLWRPPPPPLHMVSCPQPQSPSSAETPPHAWLCEVGSFSTCLWHMSSLLKCSGNRKSSTCPQ